MDIGEVAQLVRGLLEALGARVDSIEAAEGARRVVRVSSPDSKTLIGPHGATLAALNTLARRMAEARHAESPAGFLIDVNDYHEKQLEELRQSARLLAARARLFKHEVELPPMSSYERLVVHELFAEDPEIETASSGEGKFRHVVLKYKE